MAGDACVTGWFGVKCDPTNTHVVQLFPNTRFSGNALEGCQLPASIGNLANLEHLYMSNDRTPSHLVGPIPATMGKLTRLKCMYFSHTGVSGNLPRELENLVNLEVFLVRANNLTGQQGARQKRNPERVQCSGVSLISPHVVYRTDGPPIPGTARSGFSAG